MTKTEYDDYGKKLQAAKRQCGKTTMVALELLNWCTSTPETFEPLWMQLSPLVIEEANAQNGKRRHKSNYQD